MPGPVETRDRWFVSAEEEELERLEDEERLASIGPTDDDVDFEPHDRAPDCDTCGGRGCSICTAPGYAGVERDTW